MKSISKFNRQQHIGLFIPMIEANVYKEFSVAVCAYDVFEMGALGDEDFNRLAIIRRLRTKFQRKKKAIAAKSTFCNVCGSCLNYCPPDSHEN